MTHTLILTRHAKSSWDDPNLSDHERPLNKRGRASAPAIGSWLKKNGWVPDELLSSNSVRTRETWDHMGLNAENAYYAYDLYLAGPDAMLAELKTATGRTVMMLGHNPGIAQFAAQLVETAPEHARFHDYPTCATTVIQFEIDKWSGIQKHSGKVLGFAIPRELLK